MIKKKNDKCSCVYISVLCQAIPKNRYHNSVLADTYLKAFVCVCVFNNKMQVDMAGKPRASCPLFLPAQIFPQRQIIKSDFSCLLFWCDAIVVWANSRGLYKGKRGHLKCHTAAVAEAQEFPFSRGCFSLFSRSLSPNTRSTCAAQKVISNATHHLRHLLMWNLFSLCPTHPVCPCLSFFPFFSLRWKYPFIVCEGVFAETLQNI